MGGNSMNNPVRRTQRERREATIAKLLDATIECLVEHGYRDTSIGRICSRAEISHGGLFRHFSSRTALLGAATEEISRRQMEKFHALFETPPTEVDVIRAVVCFIRDVTRSPITSAWREVLVASRTNEELREAVTPAVQYVEDSTMAIAAKWPGAPKDARAFGTLILSLLHAFDSEATTAAIFPSEEIEEMRMDWAVAQLKTALNT